MPYGEDRGLDRDDGAAARREAIWEGLWTTLGADGDAARGARLRALRDLLQ